MSREELSRKSPAELEADIERTRARISDEVDAIGYRLSPEGLGQDAEGVLQETQSASFRALETLSADLLDRGQRAGDGVAGFLRRRPAQTTLLGFGFAWLLMHSSRRGRPRSVSTNRSAERPGAVRDA